MKKFDKGTILNLISIIIPLFPLLLKIIAAVLLILFVVRVELLFQNWRTILDSHCIVLTILSLLFMLFISQHEILVGDSLIDAKFLLLCGEAIYFFLHVLEILLESRIQFNGEIRRLVVISTLKLMLLRVLLWNESLARRS